MKRNIMFSFFLILIALFASADPTEKYVLTSLITSQSKGAANSDADLLNPWGVTFSPTAGAFWISNNVTGKALLYSGDVNGSAFQKAALVVTVPGGAPTGIVFNASDDFVITNGTESGPARFIFVSQTGMISGWNPDVPPNTDAKLAATVPGAIFTGITTGRSSLGNLLYVADFHNRKIDLFDSTFQPVTIPGAFIDPEIPEGYAPFNIQTVNHKIFVSYALTDKSSTKVLTGHGRGFVSEFNTDGQLLKHLVAQGNLDAPWGLVLTPPDFGSFSNALLVGNFGNGRINAYNPNTGVFLGRLKTTHMHRKLDGLWALTFGNGVSAGDQNTLYFTAGPRNESRGMFGSIRVR